MQLNKLAARKPTELIVKHGVTNLLGWKMTQNLAVNVKRAERNNTRQ